LKPRRFEKNHKQCGYFEKFAACLKNAVRSTFKAEVPVRYVEVVYSSLLCWAAAWAARGSLQLSLSSSFVVLSVVAHNICQPSLKSACMSDCWLASMAQQMQNVGQKAVFQRKGIQKAHKDAIQISCARWHRGVHGRLTRCDAACSSTDPVSKSQQEPSAKRRRHQDEKDRHLLENDSSIALGLEVLPEDVVSHIFSYLPFYEVLSLAQVSKTWLQASQNPQAFINVDLSWVDNSPQQAPGECIDLLGESYTLPLKNLGNW
jgi:hypothetical protein